MSIFTGVNGTSWSDPGNWASHSTPPPGDDIVLNFSIGIDVHTAIIYGNLTTNGWAVSLNTNDSITFTGIDATYSTVVTVRGSLIIRGTGGSPIDFKDVSQLVVIGEGKVCGTFRFLDDSRFLNATTTPLDLSDLKLIFSNTSEFKNDGRIDNGTNLKSITLGDSTDGLNNGIMTKIFVTLSGTAKFINYGSLSQVSISSNDTAEVINAEYSSIDKSQIRVRGSSTFYNSRNAEILDSSAISLSASATVGSTFTNFGFIEISQNNLCITIGSRSYFKNDSSGVIQVTSSSSSINNTTWIQSGGNFQNQGTFISRNGNFKVDFASFTNAVSNLEKGKIYFNGSYDVGIYITQYGTSKSFENYGLISFCNNNQGQGTCPMLLSNVGGYGPVPHLINHTSGRIYSDVDIEGSDCNFPVGRFQNDGMLINACLSPPNIKCPVEYTSNAGSQLQGNVVNSMTYESDGVIESRQMIGTQGGPTVNVTYSSPLEILLLSNFKIEIGHTLEILQSGCSE